MFYAVSLVMNSILWRENPPMRTKSTILSFIELSIMGPKFHSIFFSLNYVTPCLKTNICDPILPSGKWVWKNVASWDNKRKTRLRKLKLGSFSAHIFEMRTGNRNEQFSLTTFLHTTTLTLLSSFSPLGMISIKTLGDTTVLACKMFSSGCCLHVKNSCAQAPY